MQCVEILFCRYECPRPPCSNVFARSSFPYQHTHHNLFHHNQPNIQGVLQRFPVLVSISMGDLAIQAFPRRKTKTFGLGPTLFLKLYDYDYIRPVFCNILVKKQFGNVCGS